MVHVVEREEDAKGGPRFVFSVYLSPKDKKSVLGYLVPYGAADRNSVTWIKTDFGVPAEEAFPHVMELAARNGISFVVVQDPANLFPPEKRP